MICWGFLLFVCKFIWPELCRCVIHVFCFGVPPFYTVPACSSILSGMVFCISSVYSLFILSFLYTVFRLSVTFVLVYFIFCLLPLCLLSLCLLSLLSTFSVLILHLICRRALSYHLPTCLEQNPQQMTSGKTAWRKSYVLPSSPQPSSLTPRTQNFSPLHMALLLRSSVEISTTITPKSICS